MVPFYTLVVWWAVGVQGMERETNVPWMTRAEIEAARKHLEETKGLVSDPELFGDDGLFKKALSSGRLNKEQLKTIRRNGSLWARNLSSPGKNRRM